MKYATDDFYSKKSPHRIIAASFID